VKVGDLVKKHSGTVIGVVIETARPSPNTAVKVCWPGDYGVFWTTARSLEVISESR